MESTARYYQHFHTPPRLAKKLRGAAPSAQLLKQILKEAGRRGIAKKELAAAIGIKAASLSRALGKGDMEMSTLVLLAEAAGMRLALNPIVLPRNRETLAIIDELRASEPELRRAGIDAVAVFGSVAKDEARPDSDVDILVSTKVLPSKHEHIRDAIQQALRPATERIIDIAIRDKLKPELAHRIKREAIYAF
ncbi:MAG: nucleotidyltransferase domain-containing protein [Ferrovibrio sp.]